MPQLEAHATIPFPTIARHVDAIVASLSDHNLDLRPDGDGFAVTSAFGGRARLVAEKDCLRLVVAASDPAAFNRMKHDLTGLIDFVARAEALEIAWTGDAVGAALPPDLRVLTVRRVRDLTPGMRRVTFGGEDLAGYAAPGQIHCRLLFQARDTAEPEWPRLGDDGRIVWPDAGRLPTRIYTIRRVDAVDGTLDIDFVLHDGAGPGMAWAAAATPGDLVGILGPAAHGPRPAEWHLLAGDETGLPGIGRILEGLPATARGVALVEVAGTAEEQAIACPPGVALRWLHRDGAAPGTTALLADAVRALELPADRGGIFAWCGAEFAAYRDMRAYLRQEVGLRPSQVVAFSHWRRGMSEEDIVEAGASAISG